MENSAFELGMKSIWTYCDRTVIVLWSYCYHTVIVMQSYTDRTVIVLWSYCDRTLIVLLVTKLCLYCDNTVIVLWSYCGRTFVVLSSYFHHTVLVLSSYLYRAVIALWWYWDQTVIVQRAEIPLWLHCDWIAGVTWWFLSVPKIAEDYTYSWTPLMNNEFQSKIINFK